MESENCFGWKRPSRPLSPAVSPALPGHRWPRSLSTTSARLRNPSGTPPLPRAAYVVLGNPLGEDVSPATELKPPLAQLEAIFSCPC